METDLETRLAHMASQQGRTAETLVLEAVKRLVDHEQWFLREVGKGEDTADRGEFIEHSEIRRSIDSRYPG